MSNSETSESSVYAIIYVLRDGSWIICNPVTSSNTGWNEIHLYHDATDDSDRIVGWTVDDQKVLINVAINRSCEYVSKTADFHKFTDGKESFGFGFFKDSLGQANMFFIFILFLINFRFKRAVINAIEKERAKPNLHIDSYPRTTIDYSHSVRTLPASLNKFTSADQKAAFSAYESASSNAFNNNRQEYQLYYFRQFLIFIFRQNINDASKILSSNNNVHLKDSPTNFGSNTFSPSPSPPIRDASLRRILSNQSPTQLTQNTFDSSLKPQISSNNSILNNETSPPPSHSPPPPTINSTQNLNSHPKFSASTRNSIIDIKKATFIDPNAPPPPPPRRQSAISQNSTAISINQNQNALPQPPPPPPPPQFSNNSTTSIRGSSPAPIINKSVNSRASPITTNNIQINTSVRSSSPHNNQVKNSLNDMFAPPSNHTTSNVVLSANNYPRRSSLKSSNYETSSLPPLHSSSTLPKANYNDTVTNSPPPPPPPPRKSVSVTSSGIFLDYSSFYIAPACEVLPPPQSLLKNINTVTNDSTIPSPPTSPNRIIHNFEPKNAPQFNT